MEELFNHLCSLILLFLLLLWSAADTYGRTGSSSWGTKSDQHLIGEMKIMKLKHSLATLVRGMLVVLGVLALAVAFMAHSGAASANSKAYVRVVHASPAAGPVDVYVDGSKLLDDFTFGSVTGYVPVSAGAHRIQVAPDGKGRGASVIDVTVTLNSGAYYTAAALGTKSSGFSLQAFADNNWVSD